MEIHYKIITKFLPVLVVIITHQILRFLSRFEWRKAFLSKFEWRKAKVNHEKNNQSNPGYCNRCDILYKDNEKLNRDLIILDLKLHEIHKAHDLLKKENRLRIQNEAGPSKTLKDIEFERLQVNQLREENLKIKNENEKLKEQMIELKSMVDKKAEEASDLSTTFQLLHRENKQMKEEMKTLKNTINKMSEENSDQRNELENLCRTLHNTQDQLKRKEIILEGEKRKKEELERKIAAYEEGLKLKEDKNQLSLEAQKKNIIKIEELIEEKEALERMVESKEKELHRIKQTMERKGSTIKNRTNENKELRKELDKKEKKIVKYQAELKRLEEEAAAMKDEQEERKRSHEDLKFEYFEAQQGIEKYFSGVEDGYYDKLEMLSKLMRNMERKTQESNHRSKELPRTSGEKIHISQSNDKRVIHLSTVMMILEKIRKTRQELLCDVHKDIDIVHKEYHTELEATTKNLERDYKREVNEIIQEGNFAKEMEMSQMYKSKHIRNVNKIIKLCDQKAKENMKTCLEKYKKKISDSCRALLDETIFVYLERSIESQMDFLTLT